MNVLVVVDMQNDFIDGALGTAEAELIVENVVSKVKNFDDMVIYTRDTHQNDYLERQEGKNLPVKHCILGTKGWQITDKIPVDEEAQIFDKVTFGSKDLGQFLRDLNEEEPIDEIELVGLCTDICVISNSLLIKAFLPEVQITVDASCCAGVTPASHKNALEAMKMCQIKIINE